MNIAICDDDLNTIAILENIVSNCFCGDANRFFCESFTSGEELLNYLDDNTKFQIYILDIEMKELDGLQLAAQLRISDQNAIIIFVTSHKELMQQAFDVLTFRYLIKPLNIEKTKTAILTAIDFLLLKQSVFHFKSGKKTYSVNYGDIECFESIKRKITLYLTDSLQYEFYGKLKTLNLNLNFVQIHTSYIINVDKIHAVTRNSVIMKSGRELIITKKFLNSFNESYRNLLLKRYC